MTSSTRRIVALLAFSLFSRAVPASAKSGVTVKDCDASAMIDINWTVDYIDQNLDGILGASPFISAKHAEALKKSWEKTTIRCNKGSCPQSNLIVGNHRSGADIKLCWDSIRTSSPPLNRCNLVDTILHEKAHAVNVPDEFRHNEANEYDYVRSLDAVYRFGATALAYCSTAPVIAPLGSATTVEFVAAGTVPAKLALGDLCSRDTQCGSNKCEKAVCVCKADSDCGGARCVRKLGRNFCIPSGTTLGDYCKKNSDCGVGTCNNNLCVCSTDAECATVADPFVIASHAAGASRCAKPVGKKNFCQPTVVAQNFGCNSNGDCAAGLTCKKDKCVPK